MLFVLRLHYFLWFGSLSGILPYISIFGKQHVLADAAEIGLLYTVLPFVAVVTKPLFCSMADNRSSHKGVLIIFLFITMLGYGLLVFVPWFGTHASWTWWYFCGSVLVGNTGMGVVISLTDSIVMAHVTVGGQGSFGSVRLWGTVGYGILGLASGYINDHIFTGLPYLLPGLILFLVTIAMDIMVIIFSFENKPIKEDDREIIIVVGATPVPPSNPEVGGMGECKACTSVALSFSVYGPPKVPSPHATHINHPSGRGQSSIGCNDNDRISKGGPSSQIAVSTIPMDHHRRSPSPYSHPHWDSRLEEEGPKPKFRSVWSEVKVAFVQFPILYYYGLVTLLAGILSSLHWNYFNWYIDTLKSKDTLLMGLCLVVQSFLGELIFYIWSDTLVSRWLGFNHSLSITFLFFAVRYLCYGYVISSDYPYYVLIVELSQGPTFSLFYVVMTSIAQHFSMRVSNLGDVGSSSSSEPEIHSPPIRSRSKIDDGAGHRSPGRRGQIQDTNRDIRTNIIIDGEDPRRGFQKSPGQRRMPRHMGPMMIHPSDGHESRSIPRKGPIHARGRSFDQEADIADDGAINFPQSSVRSTPHQEGFVSSGDEGEYPSMGHPTERPIHSSDILIPSFKRPSHGRSPSIGRRGHGSAGQGGSGSSNRLFPPSNVRGEPEEGNHFEEGYDPHQWNTLPRSMVPSDPAQSLVLCTHCGAMQDEGSDAPVEIRVVATPTPHGRDQENVVIDLNIHSTMFSIFSALYEGVGLGIGSIIAGFSIENWFGLEWTWKLAGLFSLIISASNCLLQVNLDKWT